MSPSFNSPVLLLNILSFTNIPLGVDEPLFIAKLLHIYTTLSTIQLYWTVLITPRAHQRSNRAEYGDGE